MYDTLESFSFFCDEMIIPTNESFSNISDKISKARDIVIVEIQNIIKKIIAFIEKTIMNFNKIRNISVPIEVKNAVFFLNGRLFELLDVVLGDIIDKVDTAESNRETLSQIQSTDQYILLTIKSPESMIDSQIFELDQNTKKTYVDYMKKARTIMLRAQTQLNRLKSGADIPLHVQNNYRVLESVAITDLIILNKLFHFGKTSKYENGSTIQFQEPINVRLER